MIGLHRSIEPPEVDGRRRPEGVKRQDYSSGREAGLVACCNLLGRAERPVSCRGLQVGADVMFQTDEPSGRDHQDEFLVG